MFQHVDDIAFDTPYLHGNGFEGVAIELRVKGIDNLVLVLLEHPPDLLELPFPPFDGLGPAVGKSALEGLVAGLEIGWRGVFYCCHPGRKVVAINKMASSTRPGICF